MFYAHEGFSTDNAFTTYNGNPVRTFRAFETEKERQEEQDRLWEESNRERNLIFCTRPFVEKYMGRNFYVASDGYVFRSREDYCELNELEQMEREAARAS